jgi:two-component sensor histidine kinase/sensor domain CHASE-containing protein
MRISGRTALTFIALSLILSALFASALFGFRARDLEEQRARLVAYAQVEARSLANLLEPAIAAAYSLGALVEQTEDTRKLEKYAENVLHRWTILAHIAIAPDGVITTVFPVGTARATLGLNVFNDPVRGPDARRAVETRSLTMTGPYELKTGRTGVTAQFPVFRAGRNGEERFWGFTSAVVDLERFLELSGLKELEARGFRWALSSAPARSEKNGAASIDLDARVPLPYLYMHQVFASSPVSLPAFPAIAEVPLPNSSWTFALAPAKGRHAGLDFFFIVLASLAAGIIVSSLIVGFLTRTRRLAVLATALSGEVAERKATEAKLLASVAEKELLLREIHHRVKNNLSIVESIISLQASEARETRFEEVFNQLSKRIHSITLIHEKLYRGRDLDRIEAGTYLRDLVHFIVDSIGSAVEPPQIVVDELALTSKAALSVGLILTELCTNAVKYGSGGVVIGLVRRGDDLELSVQNEGSPLPPDFRSGNGLGLRLVEALSGQLDGKWRAESGPPVRFVIDFPATSALASPPA